MRPRRGVRKYTVVREVRVNSLGLTFRNTPSYERYDLNRLGLSLESGSPRLR